MNEKKFWELVKVANWDGGDTNIPKRRLIVALAQEPGGVQKALKDFRTIYAKKIGQISKAIDEYQQACEERGTETGLFYGSDDGFSDLTSHIVAKGETFFNQSVAEPKTLATFKFSESFNYCVPYDSDIKEMDRSFHANKAAGFLKEWNVAVKGNPTSLNFPLFVAFIDEVANNLLNGRIEALPEPQKIREEWEKTLNAVLDVTGRFQTVRTMYQWLEDCRWELHNIVSDARKAILPLKQLEKEISA